MNEIDDTYIQAGYVFSPYIPMMVTPPVLITPTKTKHMINYDKCLFQFSSIEYASNNSNTIFMSPGVYIGEINTAFTYTSNIETNIHARFIANDLIPVQPMTQPLNLPIGQLFYLDFVYNKPLTFKEKLLKLLKKIYSH